MELALHHILVLAFVQGITEFLPISSSGHLVLTSKVLAWPDQGLLIDVAVHLGTLAAVMIYFWRDLWRISVGMACLAIGRGGPSARLSGYILLATIPVFIAGYFGRDHISMYLRNIEIIAWATIGFGVLLWIADKSGLTVRRIEHLSIWNALFIGLAQVLALIPGTSRSGITMTAGRFLGLERAAAARFSLLLSIPTIIGAGILGGLELLESGDFQPSQDVFFAMAFSFIAGLLSIAAMMRWLTHAGFTPFVIYRILLGVGLLYWIYI